MSFGKAKYLLPVFIACLLVFPGLQALAAEKSKPAATAGNVVKTKYFEIAIQKERLRRFFPTIRLLLPLNCLFWIPRNPQRKWLKLRQRICGDRSFL